MMALQPLNSDLLLILYKNVLVVYGQFVLVTLPLLKVRVYSSPAGGCQHPDARAPEGKGGGS